MTVAPELVEPRAWLGRSQGDPGESRRTARRGNLRRLAVFAGVFVLALAAGQAWNFSRPVEYRASSRLQVELPEAGGGAPAAASSNAFGSRLQLFDSAPLLARVAEAVGREGRPLAAAEGEAVARLKAMVEVRHLPDSEVVQLHATGPDPAQAAAVLNAMPEVIRAELLGRQGGAVDTRLAAARQELANLERTAGEQRTRLDQTRQALGVQSEREENEAVARTKGLRNSLNTALEKEAAATARLQALADAAAAGKENLGARADPTLSSLEARAHQVREELREMERVYTPQFMDMDPRAKAARTRLAELERQVVQQRGVAQQAALQSARDDVAGAQATVERLRRQLADATPALHKVSTGLVRTKAMEEDVAQIDKARREVLERVARLEADEQRRVPTVTVIEAATVPGAPFRPDRVRDGLWIVCGAFALGVLMMGLVEAFNRAPPPEPVAAAPTVVLAPGWAGGAPSTLAGRGPALTLPPGAAPDALAATALPAPLAVLTQDDARALLDAARGDARTVCAGGLLGLTAAELAALEGRDVDPAQQRLQVRGPSARVVRLPQWLAAEWSAAGEAALLRDAGSAPLGEEALQALLVGAALDAGLADAAEVGVETLRNTCIAWLLGQGLRFSDLPALVGRVDARRLAAFERHASAGPRRALDEVELAMPALQSPGSSAGSAGTGAGP